MGERLNVTDQLSRSNKENASFALKGKRRRSNNCFLSKLLSKAVSAALSDGTVTWKGEGTGQHRAASAVYSAFCTL